MRLRYDGNGAWIVNPKEIAERLGISTSHFLSQSRRGRVSSRVQNGTGDDLGRSLITVRAGEAGWQGIFDDEGALISEHRLLDGE